MADRSCSKISSTATYFQDSLLYLLGYDIGSSSVKAAVIDGASGKLLASAASPATEMEIKAPRPGWAEQAPVLWWEHVKISTSMLREELGASLGNVGAIGISYQMHGLVTVDKNQHVLRPAIIWCDSRAVGIGERAFKEIGPERSLTHLLNSPGNFTASKLRWVQENEPDIYSKIDCIMLPGDYIAMKMTGSPSTTETGLSEGIFWDYKSEGLSDLVLSCYELDRHLIPQVYPSFSIQGELLASTANELGLPAGIPISYRAGDQPNNALALNVLQPGEWAASAGTSGVVYGISAEPIYDVETRVNTFIHVNHTSDRRRYGVLLCVNGTGRLNSWLKSLFYDGESSVSPYDEMNQRAQAVPIGADDLVFLPFGNGAERTLMNKDIGAALLNLQLNMHTMGHILRAAQEGIAFAMNYGVSIMRDMGMELNTIRATHSGMFLSPLFTEAFTNATGVTLEIYDTDGAQGAARGAGIGAEYFRSEEEAFGGLVPVKTISPVRALQEKYGAAYHKWRLALHKQI